MALCLHLSFPTPFRCICKTHQIILRHNLSPLNRLRKTPLAQHRPVRPRLQRNLPPHRLLKTTRPPCPQIPPHYTLNSRSTHQINIRTHLIQQSRRLNERH